MTPSTAKRYPSCPPCIGDCNQGRACPAREGGGYWPAMFAQNDYQHLSAPPALAEVKPPPPITLEGDEPLSATAAAVVITAIIFVALAAIAAALAPLVL